MTMTQSEINIIPSSSSFSRRIFAFFLDHILIFSFFALIFMYRVDDLVDFFLRSESNSALVFFIYILFFELYFVIFEWICKGQTPGKWLFSIRVVRRDFKDISFSDSLLRNLFRCTYLFPLIFFIPDLICLMFHADRRIGDLAAGTIVVSMKKRFSGFEKKE